MTIMVNRRPVDHKEGESITALIKRMKYTFPLLIVKVDGKVVTSTDQKGFIIKDGSDIDIIHLTSGG